jgi:hypothetical protein
MKTQFAFASLVALALTTLSAGATAQRGYGLRVTAYGASYSAGAHGRETACRARTARWVPGRFETVSRHVWVAGCEERIWVEPTYSFRVDACGRTIRILVEDGHWTTIQHPGHFEWKSEQVFVPGHWSFD